MEDAMTEYKIFILNVDGKICRVVDVSATDDDRILEKMSALNEPTGYEVWSGDRLVAQVGGSLSKENSNER